MKIRRIVVRLDPAPRSRAVLDAAVALAKKLEVELVGLFVEDADLLHFAALPFAHEVGFPSATRRPLDVAAMERALRARAREAQDMLAFVTQRAPIRWSFKVARVAQSSGADVLVAEADLVVVRLAHMEALNRNAIAHIVRAGDVNELHAALERDGVGILVLAGSDDALMGETLRQLNERVSA